MIDLNGRFYIENMFFTPKMNFNEESIKSNVKNIISIKSSGCGLKEVVVDKVKVMDYNYTIVLQFVTNSLVQINLFPTLNGQTGGNIFSDENRHKNKVINDAVLYFEFNFLPPYIYSWGDVLSIDDIKSGLSYISIQYR